jgi:hypothetical protein
MKQLFLLFAFLLLISCNHNADKKTVIVKKEVLATRADYPKPKGLMFKVDDVELAKTLMEEDSAEKIFEEKIGKKILFYPKEFKKYRLVHTYNNGLIQTIHNSYSSHRPLILTPDVIWLAICQGVSIHINEKMNSLKHVIFIKNKPNKIEVRNDSLEYNDDAWKALISSIANQTKKFTKDDFYSFFVSQFTTTTEVIKTVYQITLLESYKKEFQYVGESGCGIPSITITGEKKDWELILSKLEMLDKIGLSKWKESLKPIINEFINVYRGKINKEFWKSIYKYKDEYSESYLSGWIVKLFPYLKKIDSKSVYDQKIGSFKSEEKYVPNEFLDGNKYLKSKLTTDNFPSGMAQIDVLWNNFFKETSSKIEVYAGFFAIKQYSDKSLEPFISWAICDKKAETIIE